MINESQQTHTSDHKQPAPFGTRLKSAREALGLERKDAAAQLRLNEKIILMMEKDRYPIDLPVTFIRGYIRAYGKLLQIPEYEIKKAIEPIKQKQVLHDSVSVTSKPSMPMTSGNYFMQFFTYLIVATIIGLVGIWWYSHTTATSPSLNIVESQSLNATEKLNPSIQQPSVVSAVSTPAPPPVVRNSPNKAQTAVDNNNVAEGSANTQQSPPMGTKSTQIKALPPANSPTDRARVSQETDSDADSEDFETSSDEPE